MTFLRDAWYVAAFDYEVGRDLLARTLLGDPVVLYRTEGGDPVALEDRCCHKFLPLSKGALTGDAVQCGYHGMTYDPTGACIRIPGQPSIPPAARVRSYPAVEHLGMIWLWMGDPAAADRSRLFELPQYGDPGWGLSRGPLTHIRTNYLNMTDNLLDPAHVSFVHASTLGSPMSEDIPVETHQEDGRVVVTRWTLDAPPIGIFRTLAGLSENMDRWQYYYFYPPSISITDFGTGPLGMGHGEDDRDHAMRIYSCHFMTPESEESTHYFWLQLRNFDQQDEAKSALITEQFVMAFDEDKAILEAVQSATRESAGRTAVKLAIDNGPMRARRIVDQMLETELGAGNAAE